MLPFALYWKVSMSRINPIEILVVITTVQPQGGSIDAELYTNVSIIGEGVKG